MRSSISLSVVMLAACAGEPEAPEIVERCSYTVCGANSPVIDHYSFHDLNLDYLVNAQGFSLLGVSKGSEVYDLDVVDDRILAHSPTQPTLTGRDLEGAIIWVQHVSQAQFGIRINTVSYTNEVVTPFDKIEIYEFAWGEAYGSPFAGPVRGGTSMIIPTFDKGAALCPDTFTQPDGWQEWDEAAKMPPFHSLVFEGDRIDANQRTVSDTTDKRWFNIACGRDTLAKLRLTRHSMRGTNNDWKVSQTVLKMLSADYCGDGTSFTVAGEPLVWQSPTGMSYRLSPTSLEARWTERGATCLDVPRAASTSNERLQRMFPDIEAAIAATCRRPPPCSNPDPWTYDRFDKVVSGNYD